MNYITLLIWFLAAVRCEAELKQIPLDPVGVSATLTYPQTCDDLALPDGVKFTTSVSFTDGLEYIVGKVNVQYSGNETRPAEVYVGDQLCGEIDEAMLVESQLESMIEVKCITPLKGVKLEISQIGDFGDSYLRVCEIEVFGAKKLQNYLYKSDKNHESANSTENYNYIESKKASNGKYSQMVREDCTLINQEAQNINKPRWRAHMGDRDMDVEYVHIYPFIPDGVGSKLDRAKYMMEGVTVSTAKVNSDESVPCEKKELVSGPEHVYAPFLCERKDIRRVIITKEISNDDLGICEVDIFVS